MFQPIGPYRPDRAPTNAGVSANLLNVRARRDDSGVAYMPHPSLQVTSGAGALPAAPSGGTAVVVSGAKKVFVGTAATLQEMGNDFTWTSRGTGYAVPAGDKWSMRQFGIYLLLTNTADGMFAYNVETPAGVNAISGAPKARWIATIFDCVFAGVCDDDPLLMRNSAPNDHTNWSSAGAGYQPFADGEELMGGGEISQGYGVILQRKSVHLLTRLPDRTIYRRDKLEDGTGSVNPWGIVSGKGAVYFVDTDGFKRATQSGVEVIGQEKVNRTFIETLAGSITGIEACYDAKRQHILWRYQKATGDTDTVYSGLMAFDLRLEEFLPLEEQTTAIFAMAPPGYNADNASSLGNVDTVPYGPDSRFWVGGEEGVLGIDENYKPGFFDGSNLAATAETATLASPTRDMTTRVTVVTDAANATVAMGVRDRLADEVTYKTAAAMQTSGTTPVLASGKYQTAKVEIAAGEDWSFIRGVSWDEVRVGGPR